MRRVTAIRQAAWESYEYLQKEVMRLEEELNLTERWTPASPEWQDAVNYNNLRDFKLTVDKLEGLVVQRLFELTKANLSGTGKSLVSYGSTSDVRMCNTHNRIQASCSNRQSPSDTVKGNPDGSEMLQPSRCIPGSSTAPSALARSRGIQLFGRI